MKKGIYALLFFLVGLGFVYRATAGKIEYEAPATASSGSGSDDNLGNHIQTQVLNGAGFGVTNSSGINLGVVNGSGPFITVYGSRPATSDTIPDFSVAVGSVSISSQTYYGQSNGTGDGEWKLGRHHANLMRLFRVDSGSLSLRMESGQGTPATVANSIQMIMTGLPAQSLFIQTIRSGSPRIFSEGVDLQIDAGNSVGSDLVLQNNNTLGNVGVGTGVPASKFTVTGGSVTINGTNAGLRVGTTNFVVHRGGGISIGTDVPTNAHMEVVGGSITIRGTGAGLNIRGGPISGAALCLNADGNLSTCSSVVGADGTCTCN